jgi:cell division protein FtsN
VAKRRRRRTSTNRRDDFPGWVWMLFGLAIGLAVAFAVFVNTRTAAPVTATTSRSEPAATARPAPASVDDNGETTAVAQAEPPEARFDFYKMLPNFEVVVENNSTETSGRAEPRAIETPGLYMLQAGSFSSHEAADRRRAELALQGIESTIQKNRDTGDTRFRVVIGPTRDLDLLNQQRARLREANIDVLRIQLDD